jgi:outer membrane biosynthesis protein TonB
VKLLAIWLACVVLATTAASAAGAEPQPDAAPQAPAVAPDPAPEAVQQPRVPTQPTPPARSELPARTQAGPPAPQPVAPAQAPTRATKPRARHEHHATVQPGPARRRTTNDRADSLVNIRALLPGTQTASDSSSGVVVLAAGALLALVLASGSMASAVSRAIKGQLR